MPEPSAQPVVVVPPQYYLLLLLGYWTVLLGQSVFERLLLFRPPLLPVFAERLELFVFFLFFATLPLLPLLLLHRQLQCVAAAAAAAAAASLLLRLHSACEPIAIFILLQFLCDFLAGLFELVATAQESKLAKSSRFLCAVFS